MVPIEFSDFDVWSFRRDDAGRWRWQRTSPDGDVLIAAANPSATLEACVEDARRRGYKGSVEPQA